MADIFSNELALVLMALNMSIFVSGPHTIEKNLYFWIGYLYCQLDKSNL